MKIRSRVLKIRNLPQDEKRIEVVSSKPYAFLIIGIILGIYLLLGKYYLVGIIMIPFFLWNLFVVKNEILVAFYDSYVFFYLQQSKDECFVCFYADIKSYEIVKKRNSLDEIVITFLNDEQKRIPCVNMGKVRKQFKLKLANSQTSNEVKDGQA